MKLIIVDTLDQLDVSKQVTIKSSAATSILYVNEHNETVMAITDAYLKSLKNRKWACSVTFSSIEVATSEIEIKEVQYLHARVNKFAVWHSELLEEALLVFTDELVVFNFKSYSKPKVLTEQFYNELEFVLDQQYDELDEDYWEDLKVG